MIFCLLSSQWRWINLRAACYRWFITFTIYPRERSSVCSLKIPRNISCIGFQLVKLLRLSGYDVAICALRWQGAGKCEASNCVTKDLLGQLHAMIYKRKLEIGIPLALHIQAVKQMEEPVSFGPNAMNGNWRPLFNSKAAVYLS